MKRLLEIAFLLHLGFLAVPLGAQEKELVVEEVSQDDLGNVTDEFQEYFFEALKQKGIENYEKAIAALEKCLRLDPKPVVYFELGKNYNLLKRFSEASNFLEKANQLDPKNEAILAELYNTYYLDQQFDKALPVVEELRVLDPTFSEDLANLYILNEKFDEALALLDELDTQWGHSEYREGLRRQIYARTDNVDAGIADLLKRIEESPEEEENYLNLIFVYSESGDTEKAFETARTMLERNPDSEMVHLALYKFYLDAKDSEKAVASMKTVLKGDQIDEETKYKVLNDFLLFVAENPSLEPDLMEIVEVFSQDESNTKVYSQLGSFFLKKDQKDKALEFFQLGVEKGERDFDLLIKTLLLQLDFQKYVAAKELSEKALEEYPSQPLLYLVNGTARNQLKEYKKAEEILTFGLDFLIDNPTMEADFYQQLVFSYSGLNEAEKAAEYKEKVAKLKPAEGNE